MLPIVYENQCRACHPLKFDGEKNAVLPHRLQPPQVHQWLEDYYTAQFLKGDSKLFEQFVSVRPLPGKLPEKETKKAQEFVQGKVDAANRYVWSKSTCGNAMSANENRPTPTASPRPTSPTCGIRTPFSTTPRTGPSIVSSVTPPSPRKGRASTKRR